MSYMDEYEKLKKKRMEEEAKASPKATGYSGSPYMNEYNRLRKQSNIETIFNNVTSPRSSLGKKDKGEDKEKKTESKKEDENELLSKIQSAKDELAAKHPENLENSISTTNKSKEDESLIDLFQAGAFKNTDWANASLGEVLGRTGKAAAATAGDVALNIVKGFGGALEGLSDAVLYGVTDAEEWLGNTFGKQDPVSQKNRDQRIASNRSTIKNSWVNSLTHDADEYLDQYSLLGRTTDAVAQGVGQVGLIVSTAGAGSALGLGTLGTTALTSGTMFLQGSGHGRTEAYEGGATEEEARKYAASAGVSEALWELAFAGFGKAVNAVGLGKSLTGLDDMAAKGLSKFFKTQTGKNIAEFAVKAGFEGLEEVGAGFTNAIAKKLTYMSEEEFGEIVKDENLLEQFLVGAATSGVVQSGIIPSSGSLRESIQNQTDFITGLTANEQKVVDKVVEDRIAEEEKNGKKLTNREKSKLNDKVVKDMERGYIDTDTIESVLGGESYKGYKSLTEQETSIKEEIEALENTPESRFTIKQRERLTELREKLKGIDTKAAKSNLFTEVDKLTANDTKLRESYNERARRGQAFEADLTKYDAKQQEVIKKAVESGILNNTNRTHEFVDLVAKVSADKGVPFDFTNNQKLKESGFAIDGKQVNGLVTKDGVILNIQSAKSLDTVVGHEITHVLEGTDLYTELQTAIVEYAKSKNDYQGRYDTLTKLYENIEGANIDSELTAELVGDYLFSDTDFINNLSTNHRNVFQKIYDEIKYLYRVATAGSKEARELERVKKVFDEAYRNSGQVQAEGTKYSLEQVDGVNYVKAEKNTFVKEDGTVASEREIFNSLVGKTISLPDGDVKIVKRLPNKDMYNELSKRYPKVTGGVENVKQLNSDVNRNMEELLENSEAVTLNEPDKGERHEAQGIVGFDTRNVKFYDGSKAYDIEFSIATLQSGEKVAYAKKFFGYDAELTKKIQTTETRSNQSPMDQQSVSEIKVAQEGENVKPKYSLGEEVDSAYDSNGKQLTQEQQKYFKDSKVRDENGNLKVMYHGSPIAGFHTFDPSKSDDGISLFFTDSIDVASTYSGAKTTYTARAINTAEDMNAFFKENNIEGYEAVEKNGKFSLLRDGKIVAESDNAKGIYEDFVGREGNEAPNNYKVYLNLKNPLVVDCEGRSWNNISQEFSQKLADTYESLSAEEKKSLYIWARGSNTRVSNHDIMKALSYPGSEYTDNIRSAYKKLFQHMAKKEHMYNIAYDNFSDSSIKEWSLAQTTTREYAQKAKNQEYDGVIFKNIVDNGVHYESKAGASTVAIAFDSNQIKSIANQNPTSDSDIRYSLSADSNGKELSPAVQKRFANSKVVDENGNLKVVYHGTPGGEFTIFDKTKGSVEGDFGSGFYFTDNASDVERNYEGGGPDFENKVARRAEQIYGEEDIEYSEAELRAREELYVGSNKFEVYLNIENPAVVGETILFEPDHYYEQYSQDDYDSEDDYLGDVEQLIMDDIDNILWEIERNVDVDNTDGIADILWGAFNEGGIDVEGLKKRINNLYLEDSNGNLVGNEVTRQIIESLGYDGIIDKTVSSKFNMNLSEDTTHYIVFKPNQIKNVSNQNPTDNPDINLSLSEKDAAPTGRFLGKDIALETAPVAEATNTEAVEPDIAPVADAKVEDYAPGENLEERLAKVDESLESLDVETEALFSKLYSQNISDEDFATKWKDLDKRYTQARQEQEKLSAEMTDINNRKYESLDDSDIPPEAEAPYYGEAESIAPVDPFADRDMVDVGKRNVKAYMHENPEVKPFFQDAARNMLYDLENGTKGERIFNEQVHYESGYEKGWMGTKRRTTSDIADLLDQWGYSYAQIEAGLNAIIEDNGKENNAVSKRIEFMLDNRLRNGYKDVDGRPIPADNGYVNLLKEKQIDAYRSESFDSFMEVADQYAPPAEDIAPLKEEPAIEGEQDVLDGFEQTEQAQTEQAPERLTRAKLHSQIVSNIKSAFNSKGIDFDKVLDDAKRMNALSINDNTPQRVNDKTFGYEAGELLNELTFNKVALNESEGVKWLNKQVDTIRNLSKKYKIKPLSKESAAAQMYAEGFWVNEKNEIISYGDAELAKDFPDVQVQNRIKALANDPTIRQIYDNTLDAINESRKRNAYPEIPRLDNYYLHFRAMDDTFSKLGIPFNPNDIKAKDLPTDINGTTIDRKPGQPFFTSAMHREGKRTSFDLLGGVEKYLNSAKNQIYHIDDIQTARALWGHIADRYGQAHGLENLDVMEFEDQQEHIQKVYDGHLSNYARFLMEYGNNLAGKTALIDRGVEGLIGRRALQFINTVNTQTSRNQVGYSVSSPLTNFIPAMETIARTSKRDSVKAFAQTVSNVFHKDGFVENDPTLIRRKGADKFSKTLWEKMSDPGYILMGAVDNVTSEFIVRTKYNELTRKGMDSEQAHIKAGEWAMRVMGDRSLGQMPLLYNSKFMGLFTKYQLEVRNQLDSAFYDTFQEVKAGSKDVENQTLRNAKTAANIASKTLQIAVLNHVFGMAFEKIAGYNPAFDIISTIATLFGWDDDEDDEDTFGDNANQAFKELLGDLPYTSLLTDGGRIPAGSALPIKQLVTGIDKYGNEKSRLETALEAAPYYLLPGGYSQIKKTVSGLGMFSDEHPVSGSYTDSGNLRFPVEKTFGNVLQAGLFGQYASENARDYFDNERSPLKEKQIQEYIDVDIPIQDYWEYREGLAKLDTNEEKVDYIDSLDLPLSKKNILVNNVLDRKESIDMADYDEYGSLEEFDFAVKYPEKYQFLEENGITVKEYNNFDSDTKDAYTWASKNPEKYAVSKVISDDVVKYKSYTNYIYKIEADKDADGKSISGSKKEKVFNYIDSLPLDYGQKSILFKSQYKADDSMNMEIVEYLDSREDIDYEEMVTILTELGFTVNGNNVYWD